MNQFNLLAFLISFSIGIFITSLYKPEPIIVYKHPTQFNLKSKYKDKTGGCYKYKMKSVPCTKDAIDIPVN